MLHILAITTPIYLIVALGFVLVRAGLFPKPELRVLGKYVIHVALPALVFNALAQRRFDEIVDARYLAAYVAGTLATLGLGWVWARRLGRQSPVAATISAMGMACPNSGFVGYPILLLTLPEVAGVVLALNMLVENLLVIPLLLMMAERGRSQARGWSVFAASLKRVARNPLILSIMAGIAVSVSSVALPEPVALTTKMLAAASGALSLCVIGGALVGLSTGGLGLRVTAVAAGKLLLHPAAVFAAVAALPALGLGALDPTLRVAVVLSGAMPMMGIYTTLAQQYDEEAPAAAAALVATVASFFTLNLLMWGLGVMPG